MCEVVTGGDMQILTALPPPHPLGHNMHYYGVHAARSLTDRCLQSDVIPDSRLQDASTVSWNVVADRRTRGIYTDNIHGPEK